MSTESDLAAIDAAILADRIGRLAASARASQSEVQPYGSHELYDYRRADHVLSARGMHRVAAPSRTLEAAPLLGKPLWCHRWVRITAGLAVAIVILSVLTDLAAAALGVSASTLIIMASAAVVLCCYLGGGSRGGGRGKSFTFHGTGRMD